MYHQYHPSTALYPSINYFCKAKSSKKFTLLASLEVVESPTEVTSVLQEIRPPGTPANARCMLLMHGVGLDQVSSQF